MVPGQGNPKNRRHTNIHIRGRRGTGTDKESFGQSTFNMGSTVQRQGHGSPPKQTLKDPFTRNSFQCQNMISLNDDDENDDDPEQTLKRTSLNFLSTNIQFNLTWRNPWDEKLY